MFTALLDYTPSVEPVYDDRAKAMEIMVIVIVILAILVFTFFVLFLCEKLNKNSQTINDKQSQKEINSEEFNLIDSYNKLSEIDKQAIKRMINSLNNSDKE